MWIDGECHCKAVSFKALIDPSRVMVCHCSDCQVMSGAPFRAVALAAIESLQVQGSTKTYVKLAQSGIRRAQVFCPECATPLWATAPENPTTVVIRLGCVKQRAELAPVVQIWHDSALPWLPELNTVASTPGGSGFIAAVVVPTAP